MASNISKIIFIGTIFLVFAGKLISCSSKESRIEDSENMNNDLIVEYLVLDSPEMSSDYLDDREQLVKINPDLFSSKLLEETKTINLNLFRNEAYVANIQKLDSILNGQVKSVYGKITEPHEGYFTLSVEGDKLLANIFIYGSTRKYFRIKYSSYYGEHIVVEKDSLSDVKQDTVIIPDLRKEPTIKQK